MVILRKHNNRHLCISLLHVKRREKEERKGKIQADLSITKNNMIEREEGENIEHCFYIFY
jgi:hypothetical protein